jgi:hypothetical protein
LERRSTPSGKGSYRSDGLDSPWGWYGIAIVLAGAGLFLCWLLWFSWKLHPAEWPAAVDFVMMALAGVLFWCAAGSVRVAVAFARREAWAKWAMYGMQLLVGIVAVLTAAHLVYEVWQRIAAL